MKAIEQLSNTSGYQADLQPAEIQPSRQVAVFHVMYDLFQHLTWVEEGSDHVHKAAS